MNGDRKSGHKRHWRAWRVMQYAVQKEEESRTVSRFRCGSKVDGGVVTRIHGKRSRFGKEKVNGCS